MRRLITSIAFILLTIFTAAQELPAEFDLREVDGENFVTSVKDQQGGTCWTFASVASMESNLEMTDIWNLSGEEDEANLAEYHMDWWNGFNDHYNDDAPSPSGYGIPVHDGGNFRMASAYLTRGSGAVREQDGQSFESPPQMSNTDYHYFRPRHIAWLNAGEDLENISEIKHAVKNHGGVATCIAYDEGFIDWQYNHYQPPENEEEPNHAVTIIGWDDRRITDAPFRGAWICKNSWGSSWGNNGFFWVSYYDKYAGKHPTMGAVVFADVRKPEFDNFYFHDYHGWVDTLMDASAIMNHYVAENDEIIKSINFVTASDSVGFTLKVYKSFSNGELSDLVYSHTGMAEQPGFHSTDLNPVVSLLEGEDFYIYLRLTHGGYGYDRSHTPQTLLGSTSKEFVPSSANPDESYYLKNTVWKDFYNYQDSSGYMHTGNFCIKAYAMLNPQTGVNTKDSYSEIKLYQNNQSLYLEGGSEHEKIILNLYDLEGKQIATYNIPVTHSFPLSPKLSEGVYIYRLISEGSTIDSGKFFWNR